MVKWVDRYIWIDLYSQTFISVKTIKNDFRPVDFVCLSALEVTDLVIPGQQGALFGFNRAATLCLATLNGTDTSFLMTLFLSLSNVVFGAENVGGADCVSGGCPGGG